MIQQARTSSAWIAFTGILIMSATAQAASSSSGDDSRHYLSIGAGISSPSPTSALGENPAGLTYNRRARLLGALATESDDFDPLGYGAGFFTGNGSVGGGIMLQGYNGGSGFSGNTLLLNWGLAATLDSLNTAFGFTGTHNLNGNGMGSGFGIDLGILYNPNGSHRLGFTAFQVQNDIDSLGAGYSADLGSSATFALDTSYSLNSTTLLAKPSLGIHLGDFQMSSGYGFRVAGNQWGWIRQGLSLGVGIRMTQSLALQAYYNHLAQYYVGLTYDF